MSVFDVVAGDSPVLLSMPHVGCGIPKTIEQGFTPDAKRLPDTDWHVDKLYDFASDLDINIIKPNYSRYVIDLNRSVNGARLYPGKDNTELCPLSCFDLSPIYEHGCEPSAAEIERRIQLYWQPYHDKVEQVIAALYRRFGVVVVFDAHSIRSRVARFFPGVLPDLNIGTHHGRSCHQQLRELVTQCLAGQTNYSTVLDERFTGGYITRHYGQPEQHVHAVQLEISQRIYMQEDYPYHYEENKAGEVKDLLRLLLKQILLWAEHHEC